MRPNVSLTGWQRHYAKDVDAGQVKVPCNGCTACCRSPHMPPELTEEEITKYPDAELNEEFGKWSLPRKEDGSCVKLIDNKCSIYGDRPKVCRVFDCRVYVAAGLLPGDDPILAEALNEWEPFRLPTREDKITFIALRMASRAGEPAENLVDALQKSIRWPDYLEAAKRILDSDPNSTDPDT